MPFLVGLGIIAAICAATTDWDKRDAAAMWMGKVILSFILGAIVCFAFFAFMRIMS